MIFRQPDIALLLLIVPALALLLVLNARRRKRAQARLAEPALLAQLTQQVRWRHLRDSLWLVALFALILALMRPLWGTQQQEITLEGVSVMVLVDISNSMLAEDVDPSRLERARLTLNDLLTSLSSNNEIGLVLFAGASYVYLPVTTDLLTAGIFVESISTDMINYQGTNLETAIRLGLNAYPDDDNQGQVMFLLTDGENQAGDPLAAAQMAQARGVPIHVIAYGTGEGAPIPDAFSPTGVKMNSDGSEVITRLEIEPLERIAEVAGGTFQIAGAPGSEIAGLLTQIQRAQTRPIDDIAATRQIERYSLFALAAFSLLILGGLLPEVKRA